MFRLVCYCWQVLNYKQNTARGDQVSKRLTVRKETNKYNLLNTHTPNKSLRQCLCSAGGTVINGTDDSSSPIERGSLVSINLILCLCVCTFSRIRFYVHLKSKKILKRRERNDRQYMRITFCKKVFSTQG